jgi:hypothetical protein
MAKKTQIVLFPPFPRFHHFPSQKKEDLSAWLGDIGGFV